jgi:hypothetical protein
VVELAADGTELRRVALPTELNQENYAWYGGLPLGLAPAASLPFAALAAGVEATVRGESFWEGIRAAWSGPWNMTVMPLVLICVMAVVSGAITYQLAGRFLFAPRQIRWWTTASVLLGPAGVLTLVALRDWPAREPCSTCGRKRVVNREHCEYCGAPFAPPARDGTEVFES